VKKKEEIKEIEQENKRRNFEHETNEKKRKMERKIRGLVCYQGELEKKATSL
jgi:hypothetical protein